MDKLDLKIGNWVKAGDPKGKIVLIAEKYFEVQFYEPAQFVSSYLYEGDIIKPIPLITEWVDDKFGFTFDPMLQGYCKGDFCVYVSVDGEFSFSWIGMKGVIETKIPFVHSLQNLYSALTGKEL